MTLRPCLIHGGLWDREIAVHCQTGQPYIFDSEAYWAHNECEMHIWRPARYKTDETFRKEYSRHFPPSEPVEDWGDGSLLYSLRADLHDSIMFSETTYFRDLLVEGTRELVEKFPSGYDGNAAGKAEG